MKKNDLFKAIGIVILVYVLLSWIVPIIYSVTGIEGDVSHQIGLVSIFSVVLETFSGFGTVVLFVLLVGAFYGVLKATGAYDKIMEYLATSAKGSEKAFLITIMVIMAVISSISGLDLGLLILFPLLMGIIVKIGYDKLVALSATVGATIIGMYGSTLAGTMYGLNGQLLGLETYDKIVVKILFFVLGLAALIAFVLIYCKSQKLEFNNKKASKKVKSDEKPVYIEKEYKTSTKSRLALSLLTFFLGVFGVHRFYTGKIGTGLAFLFTGGFLGIGYIYDLVVILCGRYVDSEGKIVRNWINHDTTKASKKSRLVATLLAFFLGVLGIHRFYTGKIKTGVLYLLTGGILGIGYLRDLILLLCGNFTDKEGHVVYNWTSKKSKIVKVDGDFTLKLKERTALPAMIVIDCLILVIFLGTTAWEGIFGSNWFAKAHEAWTSFTVGGFAIGNELFGGIEALGTWANPLRFQTYSILLVIAMVVIMIIYRTNIKDSFDGFVDGIKSFVVPTIVTMLACSVFVFVYYNPMLSTVTNLLLTATSDFNVALSGIYTIINSVFYVDYYYFANTVLYVIPSIYDDTAILSIISVMMTNLYSLVMLIAPTSVLLLVSLSISEVNYTTWVKYIWKLVLTLLIISFIVFTIMLLV